LGERAEEKLDAAEIRIDEWFRNRGLKRKIYAIPDLLKRK